MRLTDTMVKRLPAPERGNKLHYDAEVKGFAVRVTAAGSRAFVLNYRRKTDGRERRLTIGAFPDWPTAAAREEAKRLKRAIDAGDDPVGDQQANRDAPTVAELVERFVAEQLPRRRPSTARDYLRRLNADILPALGGLKVHAVAFADIEAMQRRISARGSPIAANRICALASKLFSVAIKLGWRPDNPVRGIERYHEDRRTRFLTEAELARLLAALHDCRDPLAANAVRLLLLTGARRGELLSARWTDIDFAAGVRTKPGTTTKQKTAHIIPLSRAAIDVLAAMRKEVGDCEWIFAASRGGGPRRDLGESWI